MSIPEKIQTQITRISSKITDSYTILAEKGGTLPSARTLSNLPSAIQSVPEGDSATFNVTSDTGATVTASKGSKSYALSWDGSKYTTKSIGEYGDWTVSAARSGFTKTQTINVDEAKTYTADMPIARMLTLSAGSGGSVSGGGTYAYNTSVTARATPNSGYAFKNWTEGGSSVSTSQNYTFNLTSNRTLAAVFAQAFTLTLTAGTGGTVSGGGTYASGSSVTAKATASSGYRFDKWNDGTTSASYTFTLTSNKSLSAAFIKTYTFSRKAGTGGTVSGTSNGTYDTGTAISISASPNSGYRFVNWSDDNTSASRSFSLTANTSLTANFIRTYTISVQANTGGYAGGGGTVDAGNSVTLKATPNSGYSFSKWLNSSGSQVSTSNPWTFTPTSDGTYTANFSQNTCVSSNTLVTLANGSRKRIDELTYNDSLLTYNLDNGQFESADISKIYYHGDNNYEIIKLYFDNDVEVEVIAEHGFLNCTKCEYSQISTNNYKTYVGDEFMLYDGTRARLDRVEVIEEETGSWSLITKNNENFITNDVVSLTGSRYALFPITEDMVFNAAAKQADIDTYGVFEYSEFADKMSEEDFYDLNCQYYKIPLEKGIIDMDYIEREIPMLVSYNVVPKE